MTASRIIVTDKASQLFSPQGRRSISTPSLTRTSKSELVLQKIHRQMDEYMKGRHLEEEKRKQKQYIVTRMKEELVDSSSSIELTPFLMSRLESMANKMAQSANFPPHALSNSTTYLRKLSNLHQNTMSKYESRQNRLVCQKLQQHEQSELSALQLAKEKIREVSLQETHYGERMRERLIRERDKKYKEFKLPQVPVKVKLNWDQNKEKVDKNREKWKSESERIQRKRIDQHISEHLLKL